MCPTLIPTDLITPVSRIRLLDFSAYHFFAPASSVKINGSPTPHVCVVPKHEKECDAPAGYTIHSS